MQLIKIFNALASLVNFHRVSLVAYFRVFSVLSRFTSNGFLLMWSRRCAIQSKERLKPKATHEHFKTISRQFLHARPSKPSKDSFQNPKAVTFERFSWRRHNRLFRSTSCTAEEKWNLIFSCAENFPLISANKSKLVSCDGRDERRWDFFAMLRKVQGEIFHWILFWVFRDLTFRHESSRGWMAD